LTVQDKYYPVHDPKRIKDVSESIVVRTTFWRTPLQLLLDVRDNYFRKRFTNNSGSDRLSIAKSVKTEKKDMSCIKRLVSGLNHFPDDKLYWLFPGFISGLNVIKKEEIEIIVVSAPPVSSIILGCLLSIMSKKKLVIDFRDPWTLTHKSGQTSFKPDFLLATERLLEKWVLKRSSHIVTTNDSFRKALLNQHSFLHPERVDVIQNGFDSADLPFVPKRKRNNKYIVSYLGTFYMQRNPENFLKALSIFIADKGLSENDIEVCFVGDVKNAEGFSVKEMIENTGLEKFVRLLGKVPYSNALTLMQQSNLLLLLAPNQPYQIPAKTYEYIGVQRPILVLSEEGATASLIETSNCGICVDPYDIDGIRQALHHFYNDYVDGNNSFVCESYFYERAIQAKQFSELLGRISGEKKVN
jgi:glycosyltransferase involved in cell wall biosynthesis